MSSSNQIEAMFYPEVGVGEREVTFAGFADFAFEHYLQKKGNQDGVVKKLCFTGKDSNLSFVISCRNTPAISGLDISGECTDFFHLLSLMRGKVTAEYSGLPLENIAESIQEDIAKSKTIECAQTPYFGLTFSPDEHYQPLLKALSLQKKKRFGKGYTPLTLPETSLDQDSLELLGQADLVEIQNRCYVNDDPNQSFVSEQCTIRQPKQETYHFSYSIHVANYGLLPHVALDTMQSLFDIVKDGFDISSFHTLKVVDPTERKQ